MSEADSSAGAQPEPTTQPEPSEQAEGTDVLPAGHRRRLRRVLVTTAVVLTLLVGAVAVSVAAYVDSVAVPEALRFPATTTLYYADGTVLAQLGDSRRTELPSSDIVDEVKQVAVAAEDPDFWTDTAGPIARSVARTAYDLEGTGATARARVAVLAWKMEDRLSKEQVLAMFLNNSAFGRSTYGVEAAAREYFGKTADTRASDVPRLSTAEAIVLIAMMRQPEPSPTDPQGAPGFDPSRGKRAEENSRSRFTEIAAAMRDLGYLTQDQINGLTYPTTIKPYDGRARSAALSQPVGLIVNHVLSELTHGTSPLHGLSQRAIIEGGYRIFTTIDARAQRAVEKSADATVSGSVMSGQPANLQAAAVLVEPGTGRVLGYFGGSDGRGADYAGIYYDDKGEAAGFGAHPPGGSFTVHTLAAGLKAGISLDSYWPWRPYDMAGRTGINQIRNASACPAGRERSGACSLLDSTTASLNVPFYGLTVSISPAKVLEMARDAGVDSMWTDIRERVDLSAQTDMGAVTPSKFDIIVGLGQYAVTVLDQANTMATYAAGGLRARAHFVAKVLNGDRVIYSEILPRPDQPRVLNQASIADLDFALSRTDVGQLTGRASASKAGTWQFANRIDQNADAWMVGYTGSLAMAVWIGSRAESRPILDARGATIWGSGLPSTIYRDVMNSVHNSMSLRPPAFPPPVFAGNVNPSGSVPS
jgi:membrane peptidoglycan carboxypeptidase